MKTKFYYSVINCGDGSAYPQFMESKELVEFDQANADEGWGEDCSGYVEIEHNTPIRLCKNIVTIDEYIKNVEDNIKCATEGNKTYYQEQLDELNKMKGNANVS